MATKRELLNGTISELHDSLGGELLGTLISTFDGRVIVARVLEPGLDPHKLAAAVTAVMKVSIGMSRYIGNSMPTDTLTKLEGRKLMVKQVKQRLALICIARENANTGLLDIEAENTVNKIVSILTNRYQA